jgi:Sap, sulfolipid-1-addressing protein
VGLLLALAIRTYRHRETAQPPKWLGGLLEASPGRAMATAFLLVFAMPTDVASMLTAVSTLQQHGDSLVAATPFFALTLLIAALPLLAYLLLGSRARARRKDLRALR